MMASDLASAANLAGGARQAESPITRVVGLLKALHEEIENDHKADEVAYNKYVCWAKSILDQKEKSNGEAKARIAYLEGYISDLDAGRIELTPERVDLEKQISELSADIQVAAGIRDKEKADYEIAKDEMDKAIAALEKAIEVLETATQGHESGTLLALRSRLGEAATSRSAEAALLAYAAHLSGKVLPRSDAVFLQRLLTGDVPTWDWRKLNRKATFKMSYKARSFKVQEVLQKLLTTFRSNLEDATAKETEARKLSDKLMESKNAELGAAQTALQKMEKENGARGMSRSEAVAEKEALETQVANDEKYIQQVQKSLDDKKAEWKERQVLRSDEMAAISKAIHILHNDDARDLFKKSFTSQGYFFLQRSQGLAAVFTHRRNTAASTLRVA